MVISEVIFNLIPSKYEFDLHGQEKVDNLFLKNYKVLVMVETLNLITFFKQINMKIKSSDCNLKYQYLRKEKVILICVPLISFMGDLH